MPANSDATARKVGGCRGGPISRRQMTAISRRTRGYGPPSSMPRPSTGATRIWGAGRTAVRLFRTRRVGTKGGVQRRRRQYCRAEIAHHHHHADAVRALGYGDHKEWWGKTVKNVPQSIAAALRGRERPIPETIASGSAVRQTRSPADRTTRLRQFRPGDAGRTNPIRNPRCRRRGYVSALVDGKVYIAYGAISPKCGSRPVSRPATRTNKRISEGYRAIQAPRDRQEGLRQARRPPGKRARLTTNAASPSMHRNSRPSRKPPAGGGAAGGGDRKIAARLAGRDPLSHLPKNTLECRLSKPGR